jgi:hypothetical protein
MRIPPSPSAAHPEDVHSVRNRSRSFIPHWMSQAAAFGAAIAVTAAIGLAGQIQLLRQR